MPLYESVFIARQDISSSQAEGLMDSFAEIITNSGGSVSKKEYWGLRNLAYRIKKNRKGHYALLNIDAPPAAISEMERNMRLHDDILRFLTIKVEELSDEPSPILRSREERGGRGGRGRREFGDRPPRRDDRPAPAGDGGELPAAASAEAPTDAEQGEEK
ncbi:MAG: 30S ribosomal protein S6 [Alphaproteobacteria bacterium]|nr:30S ribosomal protein S6 [Alphaproteobacteria bacterium]